LWHWYPWGGEIGALDRRNRRTFNMSGGLLALLDDVVALTKLTAATLDDAAGQAATASTKAAGVVIDDAAVTPRYVTGLAAQRELPIVGRIAVGSLKNKLLYLLPAALLLSAFLSQAITPLLMLGGLYLAFEGYEKVHHMLAPTHAAHGDVPGVEQAVALAKGDKALEDEKVAGAIRTDFVLSAEIMALALATITAPDLLTRALVLAAVAVLITAGVYGVVALIVRADDLGARLATRNGAISGPIGRALLRGMPPFLEVLSFVGMLAMLWVGGGILLHGAAAFGFAAPEHAIHAVAGAVRDALPVGGEIAAWLVSAAGSAVVGVIAGAVTAAVVWVARAPFRKPEPGTH
jgi:predicted DNA repair protein MutK